MSRETRMKKRITSSNITHAVLIVVITAMLFSTIGFTFANSIKSTEIIARHAYPTGGNYKFGTISSVQLDKNGKPEWILSGHWKSNLLNMSTSSSNQANTSFTPVFDASIRMVMVNGSALHTHAVTGFNLTKMTSPDKNTKEFNGTSTVSLKMGPVTNVPISIKFAGNDVISIWLDPTKINNHFGNTPIFGTVINPHNNSSRTEILGDR
jgi:hypothetical protein